MKYWVGIIDNERFIHLSRSKPDEINFWQPGSTPPRHMDPGTLFLFKLQAPNHYVVGGGYFVHSTVLPCSLAWEAFAENNGVDSLDELIQRITHNRKSPQHQGSEIACNILMDPFFFEEQDWIPIPENWSPSVQRGKTYDSSEKHGADLWKNVQDRLAGMPASNKAHEYPASAQSTNDFLSRASLGPGSFRILVSDAYHRRCAVTNETTLPALEVAHIKPASKDGPNTTGNGLLLRADIHRLFSNGYVTLDQQLRFIVSEKARDQFANSREYYRYHGARLQNLPDATSDQPSKEFINWHNEHCFLG